ncbi:RNA polymerase factor sigma-54 [Alcaligenaceae bacterium SJ-26]|nr:RNA polymerase factor sigma-54 [Alcaligenaceae bacterium SJ-26]
MSQLSVSLQLGQRLSLTPQLRQSLRLLQLSTLALHEEVVRLADENPLLELADAGPAAPAYDDDMVFEEAAPVTLRGHLLEQLTFQPADERRKALVQVLIDALDDSGWLPDTLDDIRTWLPDTLAIETTELEAALRLLQSFDPPGIGARSLEECLVLQLQAMDAHAFPYADDPAVVTCALSICQSHLDLVAARKLNQLRTLLPFDAGTIQHACELIAHLSPHPGHDWTRPAADYVIPDILATRDARGRWQAELNPAALPRISLNQQYASLLQAQDAREHSAMHEQLQQARWLLRSLGQRYDTLLKIGQAVVRRQAGFLDTGPTAMQAMTLKDIAQDIDMHESTVSRAIAQKYMHTPHGLVDFKQFFSARLAGTDGTQDSTSATAVQALLREIIAAESPDKPVSDNQLADLLSARGVTIARRTVAKYREALRIPPASARKRPPT